MAETVTLESLLASYAPEAPTYTVTLPGGEELRFATLQSYGEIEKLKAEAVKWFANQKKIPAEMVAEKGIVLPKSETDAYAAFVIHKYAVEPAFSLADAVKLCGAPWLVERIMRELDVANKATFRQKVADETVDEKKD